MLKFSEKVVDDGLKVFGVKSSFEVGLFEGVEMCWDVRFGKSLLDDDMGSSFEW